MYLIISWFYSLRENFRNGSWTKTEKLKNWIFQRDPGRDSPQFFIFSVFQFCLRNYSGIFPETFRNICGETEKLKNRKTEKLNFSRDSRKRFSIWIQFFLFVSFSVFPVLLTELFRNISGDISEYLQRNWKLKNRKTEKLNFPERSRKRFSIWIQFSVFQFFCFFCFAYGTIPEYFRRHFGIFAEKLKNWKTEKLKNWIFPRSRKRFSIWIQFFCFFSFSVFQFCLPELFRNISGDISEYLQRNWKLKNWIFQRDPGRDSAYGFSFSVFLFCLRNYSGIFPETFQNIWWETEKQKNWKTEFSREIQEEILHMDSVFLFVSVSVFLFCLRNYSGIFPETFRNICGETEKLNFPERSRKRFSNAFSF